VNRPNPQPAAVSIVFDFRQVRIECLAKFPKGQLPNIQQTSSLLISIVASPFLLSVRLVGRRRSNRYSSAGRMET
jgi:hypothetical protein